MRFEGPIHIRPLTMRGTFGIAWRLVRRNFGAAFFYVLLMLLILMVGVAVVFSPVLGSVIKGDYESVDFVISIVVAVLLSMVLMLAVLLLYQPILNGVLYGEMSARIYGPGASTGNLFRRSKYALKRFFTTYLCLVVCGIALSIVQSIVSSMFGGIFGFAGVAAALPGLLSGGVLEGSLGGSLGNPLALLSGVGAGVFVYFGFLFLLSMAVTLGGQSFISLTYPIAVNESVFNFDAVGRSIKLASKRFGRIIGAKVLYLAVFLCAKLVIGALMLLVAALMFDSADPALLATGIALYAVLMLGLVCLAIVAMLYAPALDTVLYYDARVRLEGNAWLHMEQPETQSESDAYQTEHAHYYGAAEPLHAEWSAYDRASAEQTNRSYTEQFNWSDAAHGQNGAHGNENNDGGEHGA